MPSLSPLSARSRAAVSASAAVESLSDRRHHGRPAPAPAGELLRQACNRAEHGQRAVAVDRQARRVTLASGSSIPTTTCPATGAHNRKLPFRAPTSRACFICVARGRRRRPKSASPRRRSVVVAGAGFIGLELAAVASKLGKQVTVIEPLARCMSRAVSPAMSQFFAEAHTAGASISGSTRGSPRSRAMRPRAAASRLSRASTIPADLCWSASASCRGRACAQAAGSDDRQRHRCRRAARHLRSRRSPPSATAHLPDAVTGKRVYGSNPCRTPSTRAAASPNASPGSPTAYAAMPWFWSDQRDLKLQMVGLTAGCDRSGAARRSGLARLLGVLLQGRPLAGIESVNKRRRSHVRPPPARRGAVDHAGRGGDLSFDLKARLAQPAAAAGRGDAVMPCSRTSRSRRNICG